MAKRPPLSDRSFLAAVFSPKKNPVPTGLRRKTLVGVKGRSANRLRAYNRMSALNQQVLEKAGQRESYLRGEVSIADAKRTLRNTAVDLGIAKPLRPKVPVTVPKTVDDRTRVLDHLWRTLTGSKTSKPVNIGVLRRGTLMMSRDQLARALRMTAPQVKNAARNPDEEIPLDGDKKLNPFWYH